MMFGLLIQKALMHNGAKYDLMRRVDQRWIVINHNSETSA